MEGSCVLGPLEHSFMKHSLCKTLKNYATFFYPFFFSIEMTENGKVDFQCLIQSAVRQEISWKTLMVFLSDLTTSIDESLEVIKMLVEELEIWVAKAKGGVNTVRDNSSINEISIENVESNCFVVNY